MSFIKAQHLITALRSLNILKIVHRERFATPQGSCQHFFLSFMSLALRRTLPEFTCWIMISIASDFQGRWLPNCTRRSGEVSCWIRLDRLDYPTNLSTSSAYTILSAFQDLNRFNTRSVIDHPPQCVDLFALWMTNTTISKMRPGNWLRWRSCANSPLQHFMAWVRTNHKSLVWHLSDL